MMKRTRKLNALTSLRFFAASVIVLHHSTGSFGLDPAWNRFIPTGHAVSFFFVLSGFILTYVYRSLDNPRDIMNFYRARIGRVWPLHLCTLFLSILLLWDYLVEPLGGRVLSLFLSAPFAANVFMVHSWIPDRAYFWSFNSVSWSISTEFGFYLFFPFLLWRWSESWRWKLACALAISLTAVALCNYVGFPAGWEGGVGFVGVVAISPATRLFEFALGMAAALLFLQTDNVPGSKGHRATVAEAWLALLVLAVMIGGQTLTERLEPLIGPAGRLWLDGGGLFAIVFAVFIFVMAREQGALSRALTSKGFVLLGEISFSMYLLHQILIRYYRVRLESATSFPGWAQYLYFWVMVLAGSYLLWETVEKPMRRKITGRKTSPAVVSTGLRPFPPKGATIGAAAVVFLLGLPLIL
ncbi:MAG: acyltransferase [Deltaproteobacteria bacterium]|nr:acyltransferase [Deltaproteobacteria bacterium]